MENEKLLVTALTIFRQLIKNKLYQTSADFAMLLILLNKRADTTLGLVHGRVQQIGGIGLIVAFLFNYKHYQTECLHSHTKIVQHLKK